MKLLLNAEHLIEGDVLLDYAGQPVFTWADGTPKKVMSVELVVRVRFDDYLRAEWPADHKLDVERRVKEA
jgi:hypothetical protein